MCNTMFDLDELIYSVYIILVALLHTETSIK